MISDSVFETLGINTCESNDSREFEPASGGLNFRGICMAQGSASQKGVQDRMERCRPKINTAQVQTVRDSTLLRYV